MRKPEAPARRPAVRVLVQVERGEDEDAGAVSGGDDAAGRLDAVEAGHADVHQGDVRVEFGRHADRLGAVGRFAHDRHVVLALQEHAEAEALERLVVDDEHGGHCGVSSGR